MLLVFPGAAVALLQGPEVRVSKFTFVCLLILRHCILLQHVKVDIVERAYVAA
jgi:hypothetical protein